MRVEVLGSAAGGGFPQWNCGCKNCRSVRAGTFSGRSRTQTQLAVSADEEHWVLLGASPDLRLQIESCSSLFPRHPRHSPIAAVVITNADIDQVAGLLSLRELHSFNVYSTSSIRRILRDDNSMIGMLNRVQDQVEWQVINADATQVLRTVGGEHTGLCCQLVSLNKGFPKYVNANRSATLDRAEASTGLILTSEGGKRLACFPAAPALTAPMLEAFESADLLLFDGTFWSNDELIEIQGSGATAREMGHIPVGGAQGSLELLKSLRHPRKVYIHINNTNPMLDESSPEYHAVRAAGWEMAEDGCRFEL